MCVCVSGQRKEMETSLLNITSCQAATLAGRNQRKKTDTHRAAMVMDRAAPQQLDRKGDFIQGGAERTKSEKSTSSPSYSMIG